MTLETFFEKFDLFADAPDAVAKMRELVLEFAVQGRLTSALPSDGTVPSVIEFRENASALANSLGLRSPKELIEEVEPPFDIPSDWRWMALADIGAAQTGTTPSKADYDAFNGDISFIKPADILPNSIDYSNESLTRHGAESGSRRAPKGSLLMVCIGTIGKCNLIDRECAFNQQINSLTPVAAVDPRYLLVAARSRSFQDAAWNKSSSTTIAILNKGKWLSIPVPVPPLAEQKRIVAKVDELMALCDRLEAQQQEREMRHAALARASLARFADAPTPDNLPFLFHPSYPIPPADLRKSILALAVQGKLVPQDPKDEPAETLVQRISKERHNKIERSNADSPSVLGPVRDSEEPFQLPPSWQWVRLGDVATIKHGYAFSSESFTSVATPFVLTTPGNFHETGGFRDRGPKTKYYNGPVPPGFILEAGDLIIPMTEQAAGLLGSPAFIPADGKTYLHNQRLGKLCFYSESIAPEFMFWFFNCDFFRNELARTCTGMKVRHSSPTKILQVSFPVCSIAEQRRIVAKVDQLLALVDQLEAQLASSRAIAGNLMEAVVDGLTRTGVTHA